MTILHIHIRQFAIVTRAFIVVISVHTLLNLNSFLIFAFPFYSLMPIYTYASRSVSTYIYSQKPFPHLAICLKLNLRLGFLLLPSPRPFFHMCVRQAGS